MGGGGGGEIQQTEGEKAMAAIAAEKYNHWRKQWKPVQDQFIEDIQITPGDYEQRAGMANVDAQAAMSNINPVQVGSGRQGNLSANINDAAQVKSQAQGGAVIRSNIATDDAYQSALKSIVDVGVGKSVSSTMGLMDHAQTNFSQSANNAQNNFNSWQNKQNNLGALAGMGAYQFQKGGMPGGSTGNTPSPPKAGPGQAWT